MTENKLTKAEARSLWREAERRLQLVDVEPPLATAQVDALLRVLGPRGRSETLEAWLKRGGKAVEAGPAAASAAVIQVDFARRRFRPVAEIVRLAADTASGEIPLPARELETGDGRFRLQVTLEGDQVVIRVQALGLAADEFAARLLGIAGAGDEAPVALVQLDEDGDGEVRLPDAVGLRQALLRPVIGVIDEA